MQSDRTRCTECGGTMETGYILDRSDAGFIVPSWVAGPPTKNWLGMLKYDRKTVRQVLTDRCCACGFLKSYAKDRPL
jgi:hypothetical protein